MSDDIFSKEELAMIDAAEGIVEQIDDAATQLKKLDEQARDLSRMIAEGAEREKELRIKLKKTEAA